jgi:hypothetical protein
MHSMQILMRHMIDYAGLFPPASLDMQRAVANYASFRSQDLAWKDVTWTLGRFILPLARLDEFERVAQDRLLADTNAGLWQLSVLGTADVQADITAIEAFNARHRLGAAGGAVTIDTIELKAIEAEEIISAMHVMPKDLAAYFEIPIGHDPAPLVRSIGRVGARAKVRTGGTSQDMFPAPDELLRFIHTCVTARVPFKATAGLHHPLRSEYRLTYERDSDLGTMYGFLNVFLSAAFLAAGMNVDEAMHVLLEESPEAFKFDDDGVTWRAHRIANDALLRVRHDIAMSFGSCSFQEPIDELKAMKLL